MTCIVVGYAPKPEGRAALHQSAEDLVASDQPVSAEEDSS